MRLKGKLVQWNTDTAFGFIAPNGGGSQVFIHKNAFVNRKRIPQINDVITFSITKDNQGRNCAAQATFSGEKLVKKQAKKVNRFSLLLSVFFLVLLSGAYLLEHLPQKLLFLYLGASFITFFSYANDKSKAQRNAWRTPESTLHFLALIGGWPGAAFAQQFLRHKSKKTEFRNVFWLTVVVNISAFAWLMSSHGEVILNLFI
ncbi:cold shock and DUF1294 domain-containing protein [Colwellia sp. E2M01]|uniref:cold shock and DUF1294 domain-containing protein n=1 Tax=Colwellia sp. E2M01 TaxID=2841561 RepID=UPI001C09CC04|nr:cold shock and DUF1294 domain-containing protein [Colwellia sp. E2M01]MBU2869573.1 cold shock and DUF1294 domain-containing protein [Colwellia sp. E2M01]